MLFRSDDFYNIIPQVENILNRGVFLSDSKCDLCLIADHHHRSIIELWESGEVMKFVGFPNGLGWTESQYKEYFAKSNKLDSDILLAVEDKNGKFMGQAKIAFPDSDGYCEHDLKLMPGFQGKGFGFRIWKMMLDRMNRVWPNATALVTPSVENEKAIRIYSSMGFEFDGGQMEWIPNRDQANAVPVRFRRMIRK